MYVPNYIEMIRGTTFPAAPLETMLFYRDDLNAWFIFDGTLWVSLLSPPIIIHDIAGPWHISGATPGQILQANAAGLPIDATNTDAQVAGAVIHVGLTAVGIHGSSIVAAINTLVHRDAAGRAQIANPAVNADIDNMGARDAAILVETLARALADAMHAAIDTPPTHGSTVAATFNRLIHRDAAGRAQIVNPAVAADIDNLGARDAAIATHAALATNVHGIQNVPLFSTAVKTYYINAATGDDTKDGESAPNAWKTWGKAESMIPIYLLHNYTIRIIGDLNAAISLAGRTTVGVLLTIRGDTNVAANHDVTTVDLLNCYGQFAVQYVQASGRMRTAYCVAMNSINGVFQNCNPRNPGGTGVQIAFGIGYIRDCDFGINVVQDCIEAVLSRTVSRSNIGNGTRWGLRADQGATIGKVLAQPTGTVANESTANGGVIR